MSEPVQSAKPDERRRCGRVLLDPRDGVEGEPDSASPSSEVARLQQECDRWREERWAETVEAARLQQRLERVEAERDRLLEHVIYTQCAECGQFDPWRFAAGECETCAAARAVLPEREINPSALADREERG